MGKTTEIAWCDHTFNPWWGCARVSPGCEHCYAESFAKRTGHAVWGVQAPRRTFSAEHWAEPLQWFRDAVAANVRRRVFCASMADVFESRPDLNDWRNGLWDVIWATHGTATSGLDWLLLSKRPENFCRMLPWTMGDGPHRRYGTTPWQNVWLGVTAENQEYANKRVPLLRATPAAVRFVSCEPLIGRVSLFGAPDDTGDPAVGWNATAVKTLTDYGTGVEYDVDLQAGIDWVIVGGESGPGARPFSVEWAFDLRRQCERAGIAFFMKQFGRVPTLWGVPVRYYDGSQGAEGWSGGRFVDAKGADWDEWPPEIRVRQFPESAVTA